MIIDLSSIDVFENNEIDIDKKITFIFGKNGVGKSTITRELQKLSPNYEVLAFQGFSGVIDENKRLNAVVLGKENAINNRKIEDKKAEIEAKKVELEKIEKTLKEPEENSSSNYWTKKKNAEQEYNAEEKKIEEFYSQSAAKVKNYKNPRVATPTYNKRYFYDDIANAALLTDDKFKQYAATIKSEVKNAPEITFPVIDSRALVTDINNLLKKSVKERMKINRLENNAEKREFAKTGLKIHSKGDVCAFCGNKIQDNVWEELTSYFSANEVKSFREEIQNKILDIKNKIEIISAIHIDSDTFYPSFENEIKEIIQEFEKERTEIISCLNELIKVLDDKLKNLFEECTGISKFDLGNLDNIKRKYSELQKKNNENNLTEKQQEATDKIRLHLVKECLDEFDYEAKKANLNALDKIKTNCTEEYDTELKKITGPGGLKESIRLIQDEITTLQRDTKNETLLATNINKKLKHMVSFELVHVKDAESKGFYKVKHSITGREREITELSTGEKNVIAFLYFIEKLNEVKEIPTNRPRVIVFDDPMSSNDDGMQYLIIEELQELMKKLRETDQFILLTHNKHFYLNVKYGHKYNKDKFIRFQSDGNKTHFFYINNENEDFKTSYEALWNELKTLYNINSVSADLLLNPIRRIIETYTKFNAINKGEFCNSVDGAMKLFNVNSHSIDDVEAELNGKTKNEIIQMFYDCFSENNKSEHFRKFWSELTIDENGHIIFAN